MGLVKSAGGIQEEYDEGRDKGKGGSFLGLSLRKVSEILSGFENISHEAVRKCYLRGDKSTREEGKEVSCNR